MTSDPAAHRIPSPREGHERRNHPRATADWPITIALAEGSHEARIRDISRAGVCFFLDRRIPEMTVLRLELELPESGAARCRRVAGTGVVVRCRPLSLSIDHYEIAVFFQSMSDVDRDRLAAYASGR